MKKLTILVSAIFISCTYENKVCEFESPNEELKIYNNILNELVEKHMYNYYLGGERNRIYAKYPNEEPADSTKIRNDLAKAQNAIFMDSTKFCALYLDTASRLIMPPWNYQINSNDKYYLELIKGYSVNDESAIDSLNAIQTLYKPEDYGLCTIKLLNLKDFRPRRDSCIIGKIRLSKLVLNSNKTKGLMYCDWRCGGLCGYNAFILLEKRNSRWWIKEIKIISTY